MRMTMAALLALGSAAAAAQTLPQTAEDLTTPPEMRQGFAAGPAPGPARARPTAKTSHPTRDRNASSEPAARPKPPGAAPVDFGVVMRGGSSTSRINSPTGTSEAVQESGTAVGAGLRFGF